MKLLLLLAVLWPLAAALLSLIPMPTRLRALWSPAAALAELVLVGCLLASVLQGNELILTLPDICLRGLVLRVDGFRGLWAVLAAFAFACSCWFAPSYMAHDQHRARYDLFTYLTLAGIIGLFLANDLFTAFVFFELMSLASWGWVAHEDNANSRYAADSYLAIAVLGGLVLLMGLFLLDHLAGTLVIQELAAACAPHAGRPLLYVAGSLLLFGFGAKAGMFPLHFWLPMAHPVAPAPASALLSGVLTKGGIWGILVLTVDVFRGDAQWGKILLMLGLVTMLVGAVLALASIDLKRTLACSSVSQIGFILLGCGLLNLIGPETELAARGTLLHMVNHCLIKLVLFLASGVFALHRHKLSLNRLRGAGRKSPVLAGCFLIGALSLAGVPLTSGYVSKTLLHEALTAYGHISGDLLQAKVIEGLFLLAGGMTAAYMAKLFITLFVAKPAKEQPALTLDKHTGIIVLPTLALLLFGLMPRVTMDRLAALAAPFLHVEISEHVAYWSPVNLLGACISLGIGAVIYFWIVRGKLTENDKLQSKWPVWLDLERLVYRPLLTRLLPSIVGFVCRCLDQLTDFCVLLLRRTILRNVGSSPETPTGRTWAGTLGHLLDSCAHLFNRLLRRPQTNKHSFSKRLVAWERNIASGTRLISASLSFGLLMFSLGLCLTLAYLLL